MAYTAHKNPDDVKEFEEDAASLDRKTSMLVQLIQNSKYFVAFTGAGVSTSAGIPGARPFSSPRLLRLIFSRLPWPRRRVDAPRSRQGAREAHSVHSQGDAHRHAHVARRSRACQCPKVPHQSELRRTSPPQRFLSRQGAHPLASIFVRLYACASLCAFQLSYFSSDLRSCPNSTATATSSDASPASASTSATSAPSRPTARACTTTAPAARASPAAASCTTRSATSTRASRPCPSTAASPPPSAPPSTSCSVRYRLCAVAILLRC